MHKILPYTAEARILAKQLRLEMTQSEQLLWEKIRRNALGIRFFRQFPILGYVVDFYAKEIGLAIEVDGSVHNHQFLEDAKRQGAIEKLGVRFLRFTNKEIETDMENVLSIIKESIEEST